MDWGVGGPDATSPVETTYVVNRRVRWIIYQIINALRCIPGSLKVMNGTTLVFAGLVRSKVKGPGELSRRFIATYLEIVREVVIPVVGGPHG